MATPNGPKRITTPTLQILAVFMADTSKEWYGRALSVETKLGSGTVLQCLYRMESWGWLTSRWEDTDIATSEGRPPRRYYRLTDTGKREVSELLRSKFNGRLRFAPEAIVSLAAA